MSEVTSFTADRLQATEDAAITGSSTDASGRVTLDRQDGGFIQLPSVNFPSGAVMMFASGVIPTGWLLCNGQAVSRTTYAGLFGIIGTVYGTGNGTTTFNVPNLEAKFPRMQTASLGGTGGAATHGHVVPDHTHDVNTHDHALAGGSTAALAHISIGGSNLIQIQRLDSQPSWNDTQSMNGTGLSTENVGVVSGAKVSGQTALDGNDTNAAGNDASDASSLPPYVNMNFIIKV